jgi:hypothetical protein
MEPFCLSYCIIIAPSCLIELSPVMLQDTLRLRLKDPLLCRQNLVLFEHQIKPGNVFHLLQRLVRCADMQVLRDTRQQATHK